MSLHEQALLLMQHLWLLDYSWLGFHLDWPPGTCFIIAFVRLGQG